jgi:hypothetical protein
MAPRPALAALLAALVALGGCWADDGDDPVVVGDGDDPAAPVDPTEEPPATRPDPEDDGPVTAPPGAPTAEELRTALPEVDEVPGFSGERHDDPELQEREDAADPLCEAGWPGNLINDLRYDVDVGGVNAFYGDPEDSSADGPPAFVVALASLPDAAGLVADARAQLEACAADSGEEALEVWEVLDRPTVGDRSVTARSTSRLAVSEGGPVPDNRRTTTIAHVGDVVIVVEALVFSATGEPAADVPDDDLQDLIDLVVERVDALR